MNSWCMHDVSLSPPYWYMSAAMLSDPGAFWRFSSLMALMMSSTVGEHLAQTEMDQGCTLPSASHSDGLRSVQHLIEVLLPSVQVL